MRKLVGMVFQSLDGVMQAPGSDVEDPTGGFAHGGWQMGIDDVVAGKAMETMFVEPYALLLGRRTYDIFASFWPFVKSEEEAIGKSLTAADKYVLTHRNEPLEWENSHRLRDIDALAELKATDGPELRIWGSGALYPALLEHGLLDSLTLLTYPLVLGEGKRTFREDSPAGMLRLTAHQVGPAGVTVTSFEPAGEIPKGPINRPQPNHREAERQQRIAEKSW